MQVQQQQQQQSQQQQLRSTPWMLQVPTMGPSPSDPSPATATSTVSSSPASAFGDRSPSSAYADLAPWWSHSQMAQQQHPSLSQQPPALALDMSVLSVASTDPSPVVAHNMTQPQTQTQPQQHQLRMSSGPLTPVSPPMPHQESGQTHSGYDHVHAPVASVPRKRSLTMATEDYVFDSDDINLTFESASPVEIDQDDSLNLINGPLPGSATSSPTKPVGAKPAISNNFVSKLYQMIVDSKSAQYIQWTEHGTSFVVSNIGEFSRAILGSHFKHSNFSSFVRQLNMYGFHKLNRTPRAQRTSPDAHVWEFSHPLFLRARPDLLEQIRRKAPEAETTLTTSSVAVGPHGIITGPARRELPGDIHAALDGARQEAAQARQELEVERRRVTALAAVTKQLHDVVSRTYPNMGAFPTELLESISPSLMQARMQQHSPMTPISANSSFSAGQSTQVAMSEATFGYNNQLFGASFVQQGSQPPSIPNVPTLPVGISMGSNSSLHQDYSMATGRSTHSSPSVDGASTSTSTGLSLGWNWSTSPPSSAGGEGSNPVPWTNGSLGHSLPESHPHVAKRPRIHSESAPAGAYYGLGLGPGPAPGPANGHKLSRARSDELLGAPSWATGAATVGATQGQLQQMAGLRHIVPSIARCGRSATPAGVGEQQF